MVSKFRPPVNVLMAFDSNELSPMVVTESGIYNVSKPLFLNALSPIVVI